MAVLDKLLDLDRETHGILRPWWRNMLKPPVDGIGRLGIVLLCSTMPRNVSETDILERIDREADYLIDFINDPTWENRKRIRKLRSTFLWNTLRLTVLYVFHSQGLQVRSPVANKITDFLLPAWVVEKNLRRAKERKPSSRDFIRKSNEKTRYLADIEHQAKKFGWNGILREVDRVRREEDLGDKPVSRTKFLEAITHLTPFLLQIPKGIGRRKRQQVAAFRKVALLELERNGNSRSQASRIIAAIEASLGISQLTISTDAYGRGRKVDAILKQVRKPATPE